MSVVSVDGRRSLSDLCHIYILLQILISSVRSSEADIVSTSLNFTSDNSIPVFVNNTQTDKGRAVKSSNIIVLNKVNETISALEHKTHRRTYFNQTAGINLIGSSTNSNLSNQVVFNNLSYNGIISSPLTSSDLVRIARTINTATTTSAIIIQRDVNSQQTCNEKTHEGCKVLNFERCTKSGNCECMRGYMISRKTGLCAAVQYFWANIYIKRQPLLNVELNELSGAYQKLEEQLKRELLSIFTSQGLPGLLGVQIVHIIWKPTYVEVNFRISVEKSVAPSVEDIEKLYKKGLADTQNDGTYLYIRWDQLDGSNNKNKLTEYNHCQDSSYNYCSLNATCTHYMKSFLCKCKAGYDDISPDIVRAPGEICTNNNCQSKRGEKCTTKKIIFKDVIPKHCIFRSTTY
ncbi:uncharacterized protein LOC118764059 [Octopus sinensis]|uniref:Uncharacterized protein LOC118764059 n=1 Tax=Octopus sinensis TaxID=2607531 RepID=A0A7E6EXZ0_9MOLL|nr:uncharacterized protein LOC118764059 [Octopus sinensis]